MKSMKILCLLLSLFLLGGCGIVDQIKKDKERNYNSRQEMRAYIENKYHEKFKLDYAEFSPTAEGGYSDRGVVIPEKYPNTYVDVFREEDANGNVTFSDDYQRYTLGNDFFEYINNDIRKKYPNTLAFTEITIYDDHSANLTLDECKKSSDIDIFIGWYVDEEMDTEANIKKVAEEYARKYHKEFNNAALLFSVFWTNADGVKHLQEIEEEYKDSEYYVRQEKIDDDRSVIIETNKNKDVFDISITPKGLLEYKFKGDERRK